MYLIPERHQGSDLTGCQRSPSAQVRQLHHEKSQESLRSNLVEKFQDSAGSSTSRQKIVHDDNRFSGADAITVNFQFC